jgi:uncharacterized ferritin-like protein (DUF455 family)
MVLAQSLFLQARQCLLSDEVDEKLALSEATALENLLNGEIRCPLHHQARREAGFSNQELHRLEALCAGG